MGVFVEKVFIPTKGFDDVIDITLKVQNVVSNFDTSKGMVNIFTPSSCASILTMEMEPALTYDLTKILEAYIPVNKVYQHDNVWHNGNAYAHLKSAFLGNNITLPIVESKVQLGQYQQILLIDFDNKPSGKQVIVTVAT